MNSVFVAGATGYLGRYLCAEFGRRGFYVTALVRCADRAGDLSADNLIEAQATRPDTLTGVMEGADMVISTLGITRQADGLGYREVDFQANMNLLQEAARAGVGRFAYVHVLNADRMAGVPVIDAKAAFVKELLASDLRSTVIAPSGYFSDMSDFLSMARAGRVWLFGDGSRQLNPIHGADLAVATADAVIAGKAWLDVGGPDVFSHTELAELAFATMGQPPRITHLPDILRKVALAVLPWVTPRRINGPAQLFLSAMALDMVGERRGMHHLADHFAAIAASPPPA